MLAVIYDVDLFFINNSVLDNKCVSEYELYVIIKSEPFADCKTSGLILRRTYQLSVTCIGMWILLYR